MAPRRFGRYEVLRLLASGGMADVYLCRYAGEEGFEKRVAVKVVHPRLSGDARFRRRFVEEARLAAALSHPNLVQVFDFGREGESHYLVMEYVPGWNLAQAMFRVRRDGATVPLPVWRLWTEGLLSGIGHLHSRGVVHRDVSPSNVLLSRGGTVKVADFGIAQGVRTTPPARSGLEGKYPYWAPERAKGGEATRASDLFAAAVVAAEVFLPGMLFDGGTPEAVLAQLGKFDPREISPSLFPPEVAGVLARGLSPDPAGRHSDAASFVAEIREAVPRTATPAELKEFWDRLFSPGEGEDEATVAADGPSAGRGADLLREDRIPYGPAGNRRTRMVGAGAVAGILAAAAIAWTVATMRAERTLSVASNRAGEVEGRVPAEVDRESGGGGDVSRGRGADTISSRATGRSGKIPGKGGAGSSPDIPRDASGFAGSQQSSPSFPEAGHAGPGSRPSEAGRAALPRLTRIETDPPGAAVIGDGGVVLGLTPLSLDATRREGGSLAFEKEGYVRKVIPGEALAGLVSFRLELVRETGTIEAVQAIPWARVYDGDRYVGETPILRLSLPTGERRLRFVNPEMGIEKERILTVRPGTNDKIIVYLTNK